MLKLARQKIVFVMSSTLLALYLVFASACNTEQSFVPAYQPVGNPPQEANIEQMISDYLTDEVAADAKYRGEKLLFSGVKVEDLVNNVNTYPPPYDIHILSGLIKFTPRYNTDFDYIAEDFVVDLVGICQGWQFSRVLISDCWVGVVVGDIADITTPEY